MWAKHVEVCSTCLQRGLKWKGSEPAGCQRLRRTEHRGVGNLISPGQSRNHTFSVSAFQSGITTLKRNTSLKQPHEFVN